VSIALIDYNMGNLGSVAKALEFLGAGCEVVENAAELERFDGCILPGVGSFGDGMEALRAKGFDAVLPKFVASGKAFLGICLGMQMLLESSEESPGVRGLGIFPGTVKKFRLDGLKVPHMGWNAVEFAAGSPVAKGLADEEYCYFVHSYFVSADAPECIASCVYGHPFAAMLGRGRCFAAQFHPEKSQRPGLTLLSNFLKIAGELK
jgi:glutamine amidotransferase